MVADTERREHFRRFADRRRALLLSVHEILFDQEPGAARDEAIVRELLFDFCTDGALMATIDEAEGGLIVRAAAGDWPRPEPGTVLRGAGLDAVLRTGRDAPGALGLTRFRMPSAFGKDEWDAIWSSDLGTPATGLLGVSLNASAVRPSILWLVLTGPSREWSSHDRELLEEVASLLARAEDKGR